MNTPHLTCSNHHVTNLTRQYQDWFNTITLIPSYYVPCLQVPSKIMQLVFWMDSRVEPTPGFDTTDITRCNDISLQILYELFYFNRRPTVYKTLYTIWSHHLINWTFWFPKWLLKNCRAATRFSNIQYWCNSPTKIVHFQKPQKAASAWTPQ